MREYLKTIRERKGITQLQMAKKLNITESGYNLIENGKRQRKMDFPLMSKIADVLEISIEEIASYEKNGYIDKKEGWWSEESIKTNKTKNG